MKHLFTLIFLLLIVSVIQAQTHKNWEAKEIEAIYEKVPAKKGTLDENGKKIAFTFVPTEMRAGTYEYRIVDYKNDLYEIVGTKYYVKFRNYVGYWGYRGKEGILEIGYSSWSNKFYIKP